MGKHRRTRHGRKAKQSGAAPVVPSTMVETVANNANANSTVQSDTTYPKSGGNTNTSMPNSNFDVTNPNSGGNTSTNAAMPAVGLDETVATAATTVVHYFEHSNFPFFSRRYFKVTRIVLVDPLTFLFNNF